MPEVKTAGPAFAISGPGGELVSVQAAEGTQISSLPSFSTELQLTESPTQTKTQTKEELSEFQYANIRGQVQWEKHMKDVVLVIVALLVIPMYLLLHLTIGPETTHSNAVCIGILLISLLLFSTCISAFTSKN